MDKIEAKSRSDHTIKPPLLIEAMTYCHRADVSVKWRRPFDEETSSLIGQVMNQVTGSCGDVHGGMFGFSCWIGNLPNRAAQKGAGGCGGGWSVTNCVLFP